VCPKRKGLERSYGIIEQMSEQLNPDDFIITRKRKKYKFALFHNSPLCFEFDQWPQGSNVDVVEVGAGNAHFLVELAVRHPEQQFVALDVKADRLQSGARKAEALGVSNIRFVRARADQIDELFAPHSLRTIWLTFSDPFPRERSAGRRMTHPSYLKKYAGLLRQSTASQATGGILIKHDNPNFFQWSLEQLIVEKWHIIELTFDLHESELSDEYKILTAYEQRWLSEGLTTQFVRALR